MAQATMTQLRSLLLVCVNWFSQERSRQTAVARPVTITTDFGEGSGALGILDGKIQELSPLSPVIRLANNVPPYDLVAGAAAALATAYTAKGSVHVVVIDPEVGTKRHPLAIKTRRGDILVGPDNGVLLPAAELLRGIDKVYAIEDESLFYLPTADTVGRGIKVFDGVRVFAPVAAYLASGKRTIESLGGELSTEQLRRAPFPLEAPGNGNIFEATVIGRSDQGNLVVNLTNGQLDNLKKRGVLAFLATFENNSQSHSVEIQIADNFSQGKEGQPLAIEYITGMAAFAINCGSFASQYSLKNGSRIKIQTT